jgi:quercetin dioxygenase-like cupin family protein
MTLHRVTPAHSDSRGTITDILEDEVIEHVSVITTAPGAIRGNHVHHETHQWVYVLTGALRYVTSLPGSTTESGVARAGDVLATGPLEAHAIEALEDTTMVVMTRGPRGGREYESDTYRLAEPLLTGETVPVAGR